MLPLCYLTGKKIWPICYTLKNFRPTYTTEAPLARCVVLNIVTYIRTGWFFLRALLPARALTGLSVCSSRSYWGPRSAPWTRRSPVSGMWTKGQGITAGTTAGPAGARGRPGVRPSRGPSCGRDPASPPARPALSDRHQIPLQRAPHALHSWEGQRLLSPLRPGFTGAPFIP